MGEVKNEKILLVLGTLTLLSTNAYAQEKSQLTLKRERKLICDVMSYKLQIFENPELKIFNKDCIANVKTNTTVSEYGAESRLLNGVLELNSIDTPLKKLDCDIEYDIDPRSAQSLKNGGDYESMGCRKFL